MYEQIEKHKVNKSRAVASTAAKMPDRRKQGIVFFDNLLERTLPSKLNGITSRNVCVQRMWWTLIGGKWVPDEETNNPIPTHWGKQGERYNDENQEDTSGSEEEIETIEDLKKEVGAKKVSIGDYNTAAKWLRKEVPKWKGEDAHKSNTVHMFPKTRLDEMANVGATIEQLKTVMKKWNL
ncbi:hypothetical protein [Vibrio coralliilyticus]|uniref:hypothetical protein n=1 Tax=Vibrio coralliilyticus TaxID=190893 RepID=UPI002409E385|nr:hypothetical protein [Vibrio coralliilyticus]WFB47053.1 hypothetical protein P6988_13135 [Vibrio coralliilyticus]